MSRENSFKKVFDLLKKQDEKLAELEKEVWKLYNPAEFKLLDEVSISAGLGSYSSSRRYIVIDAKVYVGVDGCIYRRYKVISSPHASPLLVEGWQLSPYEGKQPKKRTRRN